MNFRVLYEEQTGRGTQTSQSPDTYVTGHRPPPTAANDARETPLHGGIRTRHKDHTVARDHGPAACQHGVNLLQTE